MTTTKKRWVEVRFTHWNGIKSSREAPVIVLTLSEGNKKGKTKELAKATYYYPGDDDASDFKALMSQLTDLECQWIWRIIGTWIER